MSDNRHTVHVHATDSYLKVLDDQDEEDTAWCEGPLSDEVIDVRRDLVPPFMSAEKQGILPSMIHPSYPFGNPYKLSSASLHSVSGSSKIAASKAKPHKRHEYIWTDLALENLLPWEGEDLDPNHWAGQQAEAAAASHAAAVRAAAAEPGDEPAAPANEEGMPPPQVEAGDPSDAEDEPVVADVVDIEQDVEVSHSDDSGDSTDSLSQL